MKENKFTCEQLLQNNISLSSDKNTQKNVSRFLNKFNKTIKKVIVKCSEDKELTIYILNLIKADYLAKVELKSDKYNLPENIATVLNNLIVARIRNNIKKLQDEIR